MRFFVLFGVLFCLVASGIETSAQEPVREPVEIGEAGTQYLRSIRLRGIDPDVAYFDPTAPAPKLDTTQQPSRLSLEQDTSGSSDTRTRWIVGLVAGLVLAGIAYLVLRFGGNIAVSLKQDADNPESRRRQGTATAPAWAEKLGSFNDILKVEDRRRALVLMTQKVLASLASANGVLMQKSWTARDTLNHIPLGQAQMSALRALVLNSERVQFGGRDVTEAEFHDHVSSCRRLLGAGAS